MATPWKNRKRTTVAVRDDLHEKLRRVAFENRTSITAVLDATLEEYFAEGRVPEVIAAQRTEVNQ